MQVIKGFGTIPFSLDKILKAFSDYAAMDKWEKTFKKHVLVEKLPPEDGAERVITYNYVSCPFPISDRDIVKLKKTWNPYGGDPNQVCSLEITATHSKYPEKKDPVRADTVLEGTLFKVKSPNETIMYIVNITDLKLTVGKSIADKKAPEKAMELFENLTKYLKKTYK